MKTSRIKSDPPSLYSAIKEAAAVLQETRLQISSILAVQADIQERLTYWQAQMLAKINDNPIDRMVDDDQQSIRPPTVACISDDIGKSLMIHFKCKYI